MKSNHMAEHGRFVVAMNGVDVVALSHIFVLRFREATWTVGCADSIGWMLGRTEQRLAGQFGVTCDHCERSRLELSSWSQMLTSNELVVFTLTGDICCTALEVRPPKPP